jgi:hypothetical protein
MQPEVRAINPNSDAYIQLNNCQRKGAEICFAESSHARQYVTLALIYRRYVTQVNNPYDRTQYRVFTVINSICSFFVLCLMTTFRVELSSVQNYGVMRCISGEKHSGSSLIPKLY